MKYKEKGNLLLWIGEAVSMLVDPQGAVIIDTQCTPGGLSNNHPNVITRCLLG
jgi:hypothetical protein